MRCFTHAGILYKITINKNYFSKKSQRYHNLSNKIDYLTLVTCCINFHGNIIIKLNKWLQNKRPFLKCELFYNEMNFLKKNCVTCKQSWILKTEWQILWRHIHGYVCRFATSLLALLTGRIFFKYPSRLLF